MAEHLMNVVRGFGSILEIWPAPIEFGDLSPLDANEMVRRSWEEVGDALRGVMTEEALGSKEEATTEALQESAGEGSKPQRSN